MTHLAPWVLCLFAAAAAAQTAGEKKKDSELDALELTAEPPKAEAAGAPKAGARSTRLAFEAATGRYDLRQGLGHENTYRASVDLRWSGRLAANWRGVFSDRLDHIKPADGDRTINTLREAFVGWQSDDAANAVEFGRINLRTGPGYGYNPSDFFRDGSLRTSTTLDPIALRDYRMGSVALRAQRVWSGGSVGLIVSPQLDDQPDRDGGSLDLGSTNHASRLQLGWSQDLGGGVSVQLLGFKQSGESARIGGNLTSLIGDSVVLHLEGSHGREPALADRVFGTVRPAEKRASRLAAGFTAALPGSLSLTAEVQYNGFALSEGEFAALGGGPAGLLLQNAYLAEADRLQDLAARRAVLVYVSKKGLGVKGLDLTAFVRVNTDDHSRLIWSELRQQLGAFDVALQWQQLSGRPLSEFGVVPLRRSWQLVLTYRL